MESVNIFLDDERNPRDFEGYDQDEWLIARNYDDFILIIKRLIEQENTINKISFDNDLGDIREDREYDGYYCAKWLAENNIKFRHGIVHSWNTVAKDNIWYFLNNYQEHTNNINVVGKVQLVLKK